MYNSLWIHRFASWGGALEAEQYTLFTYIALTRLLYLARKLIARFGFALSTYNLYIMDGAGKLYLY